MADSYDTEMLIQWADCSVTTKWLMLATLAEIHLLPEIDVSGYDRPHSPSSRPGAAENR